MGAISFANSSLENYNKYNTFLVGNAATPIITGAYDLLETTVLGSDTASVSFTGLGSYSDYTHLQIRATMRSDRADTGDVLDFTLNSDTGSNYAYHQLGATGTTVNSTGSTSTNFIRFQRFPGGQGTTNSFAGMVMDILDFSSASKNTTIRGLLGFADVEKRIYFGSGLYNSTSAVTSIELDKLGSNFVTGSRFSLYGIRAA